MIINFYKIILSLFLIFFSFSCSDPDDNGDSSSNTEENESTLDQSLSGQSALLEEELFFSFESDIKYTYDYYSVSGIGWGNTIKYPCTIRETDTLDFFTFSDYLLEAKNCDDESIACEDDDIIYDTYVDHSLFSETYGTTNSDLDGDGQNDPICSCSCIDDNGFEEECGSSNAVALVYDFQGGVGGFCQNSNFGEAIDPDDVSYNSMKSECESKGWTWFVIDNADDPDGANLCSSMDVNRDCTLEIDLEEGIINGQSVTFSETWRNLESLEWDISSGRYKSTVSDEQEVGATLTDDSDIYNKSQYWSIINKWEEINGMVFIDHSEWKDTVLIHLEKDDDENNIMIIMDTTLVWPTNILSSDSLVYRINSDCNNDGIWTREEDFDDYGVDGCPDENETGIYLDEDGDVDAALSNTCGECQLNAINDTDGDGICDFDPNGDNIETDAINGTEGNLQYDEGEPFDDREDNLPSTEIFWDANGNGLWDSTGSNAEPFVDLNCNLGSRDYLTEDHYGNGIWDADEVFQDLDGNGEWNDNEPLYALSASPNQLVLNYDVNFDGEVTGDEISNPQVINNISFDSDENTSFNSAMAYLNNDYVLYENIIATQLDSSYNFNIYNPIDSIETVWSNEIIEDVPSDLIERDYYVTKTFWDVSNEGVDIDGDGASDRYYDYDYHLFRYTTDEDDEGQGHLVKLVHPAYYYHYGYFDTPDEIEEGFYETIALFPDIMIYAPGGMLREGERVSFYNDTVIVPENDMQYIVDKEFDVTIDTTSAPLRKVLGKLYDSGESGNLCNEGRMIKCFADDIISCIDMDEAENDCGSIQEIEDCSSDTLYNAFKIIRTKNITLIGNGVEFGERNTIWLVDDIGNGEGGMIRDKLEHRWTEDHFGDGSEEWKEFSRLELKAAQIDNSISLDRMFNNRKIIHIDDIENEADFNHDPFIPNPTAIIQRIRIPNE